MYYMYFFTLFFTFLWPPWRNVSQLGASQAQTSEVSAVTISTNLIVAYEPRQPEVGLRSQAK